jgi:hypothetical protein
MSPSNYGTRADGQKQPKIAKIYFNDGDRVMVIDVELEPNKSYEIPFFADGDFVPRGKDGMLLAATTVRFSTGPAGRGRRR